MSDKIDRPMKPNSQKKHSQIIDSAIIWITLGTLFAVPIIFNYFHVVSVFSELKLVTLHLGAALISILWLWELTHKSQFSISLTKQQIGWGLLGKINKHPIQWVLTGAVIWFSTLTISTLLSPLSSISFFGLDDNRSG